MQTRELGISLDENNDDVRVITTTLEGARAMNRVKHSFEMQALVKAWHTDEQSIPEYGLCDWDEITIKGIQAWSLGRRAQAHDVYALFQRNFIERLEEHRTNDGLKVWGGYPIDTAIARDRSYLGHLIKLDNDYRSECEDISRITEPFEDQGIASLVINIVDRELGVE